MPQEVPKPAAKKGSNFVTDLFDKFLSLFGLLDGPDRIKAQALKECRKNLKKNAKKYIKVGPDLIEPGLGKFFYELYAILGSAQTLLEKALSSGALKNIVIESLLSPEQSNLRPMLDEAYLNNRAKEIPVTQLVEEVRTNLSNYMGGFDLERAKKIDALYNQLLAFLDLLQFNYFFLLKKFDSALPEKDFVYIPRFEPLNGSYVVDDLKDFLERSQNFPATADWNPLFDILKAYRGVEVVARENWKKAMTNFLNLKRSGILPQIVVHLTQDPAYKVLTPPHNEKILEPYLNILRTQVELQVQKIVQEKKHGKILQLVKTIFGSESVSRTKNYTEKANMLFSKRRLAGYLYIEPLNYLKAFLLDFYKRDVRELINLILVKGQWGNPALSQPLSESFHFLMDYSEKLLAFDDSLAEDTEKGQKIKLFLSRSERDQNAMSSLKVLIKDANATARVFIMESANHLITIGKNLKLAIEDIERPKHELIRNWKALEGSTDKPLKEWMVNTYKTIFHFIQLMQYYVKENQTSE